MKKIINCLLLYIIASCSSPSNSNETNNNSNVYSYTLGSNLIIDNFPYQTIITSCNQTWTKLNLRSTHYKNGDPIPQVSDPTAWAGLTTGAYCNYPSTNDIYGKLYNWYAVTDPRGLAPNGWHIPSKSEWDSFANCLGGEFYAGEYLKEAGTNHWLDQNNNGNNVSGFTGFGGGLRSSTGNFVNLKMYGVWWSSTEYSTSRGNCFRLSAISKALYNDNSSKNTGYSIRLVKN